MTDTYETSLVDRLATQWDVWQATHERTADVEARQRRRLARLVEFVRHRSAFYERRYADLHHAVGDASHLPVVTKSDLMRNFDAVVTDPAVSRAGVDAFLAQRSTVGRDFRDRYAVWTTSGTTGDPGVFLQDGRSWAVFRALGRVRLLAPLAGPEFLTDAARNRFRTALVAVGGGHYAGAGAVARMQKRNPILGSRVRLVRAQQPLPELIDALNEYQPAFLAGYSTAVRALAAEQRGGRLDIDPALVVPTAEPITREAKGRVAETFGAQVREHYGATECSAIAFECPMGRLHVNADWVVLEPVDESNDPVPPGEQSHTVLLTNLANRIQPVVRYDLGDSVTIAPDGCPCPRPLPAVEVQGRSSDVLSLPGRDGGTVSVLPLPLSTVLTDVQGVRRVQVVQTEPATLRVRLETDPDTTESVVWRRLDRRLSEHLSEHGAVGVRVTHADERPKTDPTSGKFRPVYSEVS